MRHRADAPRPRLFDAPELAQIVLDILFTLKIPGKLVSAALTALSLFTAACAYASEPPNQWFLFGLGLALLIVLFARVQAGVRHRLSELPSAAVGAMYVAMVRCTLDDAASGVACVLLR